MLALLQFLFDGCEFVRQAKVRADHQDLLGPFQALSEHPGHLVVDVAIVGAQGVSIQLVGLFGIRPPLQPIEYGFADGIDARQPVV